MSTKGEARYRWEQGSKENECCEDYQVLFRPDGTEVTVLTEPEDRWFGRDVGPIVDELNMLYSYIKDLAGLVPKGEPDA